jgi:hypothetical protein
MLLKSGMESWLTVPTARKGMPLRRLFFALLVLALTMYVAKSGDRARADHEGFATQDP